MALWGGRGIDSESTGLDMGRNLLLKYSSILFTV